MTLEAPVRAARRTNKERSATTRTALLEATVECLYAFGYAATTTQRVVERAGLTRGAALHHFPSKVDLVLATALHIIDVQNNFRRQVRNAAAAPDDQLLDSLRAGWKTWELPHAFALLEIMIGSRGDLELAARYPEIKRRIEGRQRDAFWTQCQAAGIRDRQGADALLVLGVAALRGLAMERMFTDNPAVVDRAFEMLVASRRMLIRELRGEG